MKNCTLLLILFLSLVSGQLVSQETDVASEPKATTGSARLATPPNMWEVTPHFGAMFVAGDVKSKFGYGGGLSIRKATDYIFSLRVDFLYGMTQGENDPKNVLRDFEMNWMSGTAFGVFSLNTMRFDKPIRKTHIYAMAGAGGNSFKVPDYTNEEVRNRMIARDWAPHVTLGAGIALRVSPAFNIGLEHQASTLFGKRTDLLDGTMVESNFRDILNYTNLRLSFNIGNKQKKAEPLYWINPLQVVLDDIQELKNNQGNLVLEDSDGDGVIDQLDKEPDTAPGALVDTKGRTLDSDRDGVPDHLDREPYYTPREGERVDENGVVTNPTFAPGGGVTEDRVRELIDEALQNYQPAAGRAGGVTDLFLPMVHFGINSTTVKYSDYGTLASIARVLKDNPNTRLVVKGYTDQTGTETYNQVLSYDRAKAVVDHLVNNHGIGRGRLVLMYGGQDDALVPSSSSYMNRRVEFSVAKPDDVEMDPPAGAGAKKSGY